MIKKHLPALKTSMAIDFVVANGENLAHGFGFTLDSVAELQKAGVDLFTGGNHTWDKKEVTALFETHPIIRPLNYPAGTPGKGSTTLEKGGKKLTVVNLMGHFSMGMVENPFNMVETEIERLHKEGAENIFVDFHAEATSEKNALFRMLQSQVGFIAGTHTHVGTDDLMISEGTGYVSDVGLTGCIDGVIGMEKSAPIYRFKTGLKKNYDIPKKCKKLFQAVIFTLENNTCTEAFKLKAYDGNEPKITMEAQRL